MAFRDKAYGRAYKSRPAPKIEKKKTWRGNSTKQFRAPSFRVGRATSSVTPNSTEPPAMKLLREHRELEAKLRQAGVQTSSLPTPTVVSATESDNQMTNTESGTQSKHQIKPGEWIQSVPAYSTTMLKQGHMAARQAVRRRAKQRHELQSRLDHLRYVPGDLAHAVARRHQRAKVTKHGVLNTTPLYRANLGSQTKALARERAEQKRIR